MELGADLENTKNTFNDLKHAEEVQEQGKDATLVFLLPNGESFRASFKVGVTVAYVKLVVEKNTEIPCSKQILKINGKALIDPLSIIDCGVQPGSITDVTILEA
mmetsp:Transcript_28701/g.52735  ORF Transcript_28701/g.52735 Transcript_28701/m.52735 type:complete len:104 (-) Transcript_28701:205-516(-)